MNECIRGSFIDLNVPAELVHHKAFNQLNTFTGAEPQWFSGQAVGVQLAVKVPSWLLLVHGVWRSGYTLLSHQPVPIFRALGRGSGAPAVCITSDELLRFSFCQQNNFFSTSDLPETLLSALF